MTCASVQSMLDDLSFVSDMHQQWESSGKASTSSMSSMHHHTGSLPSGCHTCSMVTEWSRQDLGFLDNDGFGTFGGGGGGDVVSINVRTSTEITDGKTVKKKITETTYADGSVECCEESEEIIG